MGHESREKKRQQQESSKVPGKILRAVAAFILVFPLMPIAFAIRCYRDNVWPWDELI